MVHQRNRRIHSQVDFDAPQFLKKHSQRNVLDLFDPNFITGKLHFSYRWVFSSRHRKSDSSFLYVPIFSISSWNCEHPLTWKMRSRNIQWKRQMRYSKKKYIEKAPYYQVSTAAEWFVASQRKQADLKVKRLALKIPLIMVEFSSFISKLQDSSWLTLVDPSFNAFS